MKSPGEKETLPATRGAQALMIAACLVIVIAGLKAAASLLLPFGWPDFLAKIGWYISSLVSIDFGCAHFEAVRFERRSHETVLGSGWSLLRSARWRPTLTSCTCTSSC